MFGALKKLTPALLPCVAAAVHIRELRARYLPVPVQGFHPLQRFSLQAHGFFPVRLGGYAATHMPHVVQCMQDGD
jgi:hypothetical protein